MRPLQYNVPMQLRALDGGILLVCGILGSHHLWRLVGTKRSLRRSVGGFRYEVVRTRSPVADEDALLRLVYLRDCTFLLIASLRRDRAHDALSQRLEQRMQTCVISERGPPASHYIASTIDKGRIIYICLRDPRTGDLLSSQHTLYIFLHELAHVATDDIGHTDTFRNHMSLFVTSCVQLGILEERLPPVMYCGTLWLQKA